MARLEISSGGKEYPGDANGEGPGDNKDKSGTKRITDFLKHKSSDPDGVSEKETRREKISTAYHEINKADNYIYIQMDLVKNGFLKLEKKGDWNSNLRPADINVDQLDPTNIKRKYQELTVYKEKLKDHRKNFIQTVKQQKQSVNGNQTKHTGDIKKFNKSVDEQFKNSIKSLDNTSDGIKSVENIYKTIYADKTDGGDIDVDV
jgi:hypothetical protein